MGTVAVTLQLPDRRRVSLRPGDMIGRMDRAALVLNDPRVSEAHALVSLRRGELFLLSLRRMIGVRGKPMSEVRLEPGTEIDLAADLTLRVVDVTTPHEVIALKNETLGVRLLGEITSLVAGPPARLVGRFVADAHTHVWSAGPDHWQTRSADGEVRALRVGDTLSVGDAHFSVVKAPLEGLSVPATLREGALDAPLRILVRVDSVELRSAEQPPITLTGVNASIVSALCGYPGPVNWDVIAREVWSDGADLIELRHRFDVSLGRLRGKLRAAGLRSDLLRASGSGQLQLVLYDGDQVVEQT